MKHYNKDLQKYAQLLRRNINSTSAEKKLWNQLLSKKKMGAKFRRQHPLKNYIVDFFCCELDLIIEVDGKVHKRQIDADLKRQKHLEQLGFVVLRFSNEEVLFDIIKVQNEIFDAIYSIREKRSA